jgi:hypothetical protein
MDDAYFELQLKNEQRSVEIRKERFVYIFVMLCLFDGLILAIAPKSVCIFFIISSLILAIALAKWLEFPWIVTNLEVWLTRLGRMWDQKFGGGPGDEIEPQ